MAVLLGLLGGLFIINHVYFGSSANPFGIETDHRVLLLGSMLCHFAGFLWWQGWDTWPGITQQRRYRHRPQTPIN